MNAARKSEDQQLLLEANIEFVRFFDRPLRGTVSKDSSYTEAML